MEHRDYGAVATLGEPVQRRQRPPYGLILVRVDVHGQVGDERIDDHEPRLHLGDEPLELLHVVGDRYPVLDALSRLDAHEADAIQVSLDGLQSWPHRRRGRILGRRDQGDARVRRGEQTGQLALPEPADAGENGHHPLRDTSGFEPFNLLAVNVGGRNRDCSARGLVVVRPVVRLIRCERGSVAVGQAHRRPPFSYGFGASGPASSTASSISPVISM